MILSHPLVDVFHVNFLLTKCHYDFSKNVSTISCCKHNSGLLLPRGSHCFAQGVEKGPPAVQRDPDLNVAVTRSEA